MAETKPGKKGTQQSAKRTTGKASKRFTDEETAAMRERAQELKTRVTPFLRDTLWGGPCGRPPFASANVSL